MREEVPVPTDPDEDAKAEVQSLKARLAQLEPIDGLRLARGSAEAVENIRSKVAKRRVGCCAEDVLPSTEQDLCCWLDDKQVELRDALDMADRESAAIITGLISRGLAKLASFSVPPICSVEHGLMRRVVARHGLRGVGVGEASTQALCPGCDQEEVLEAVS